MAFLYYHAILEDGQKWMDNVTSEEFLKTARAIHQTLKILEPFVILRAEREIVDREIFQNGDPEAVYSYDTITTQVTTPKGARPEKWGILIVLYNTTNEPQETRRKIGKKFHESITEIIRASTIGPLIRISAIAHLRKRVHYNILPNKKEEWCYTRALKEEREEYEMSIPEGLEGTIVNGNGTIQEEGTY